MNIQKAEWLNKTNLGHFATMYYGEKGLYKIQPMVKTPQVFGRINFYKKFVTNEEEAPPNPPRRGGL